MLQVSLNTIFNRYTEDTQLKIHMSPSSAPDLRIALLRCVVVDRGVCTVQCTTAACMESPMTLKSVNVIFSFTQTRGDRGAVECTDTTEYCVVCRGMYTRAYCKRM